MSDKEQKSLFGIQKDHIKAKEQDDKIKQLEEKLERERDARLEERFLSLLVLVIILDVFFFTLMPSWGGPIAILILELLLLIPIARRMGVDKVAKLLDKVLFGIIKRKD